MNREYQKDVVEIGVEVSVICMEGEGGVPLSLSCDHAFLRQAESGSSRTSRLLTSVNTTSQQKYDTYCAATMFILYNFIKVFVNASALYSL